MDDRILAKLTQLEDAKIELRNTINTFAGENVLDSSDLFEDYPTAFREATELTPVTHGVNYYNYRGDLLYTYTPEEFLVLTSHPEQDTSETLIGDGWNWSLSDAQKFIVESCDLLNIGGLYKTKDNKTHIYIDIPPNSESLYIMCIDLSYRSENAGELIHIDWGDGVVDDINIIAYTAAGVLRSLGKKFHTYQSPGEYDIAITMDSGVYYGFGVVGSNRQIAGYTYTTQRYCAQYIKYIECAENLVYECMAVSNYGLTNIEYVSIPRYTNAGTFSGDVQASGIFGSCRNLKAVIVPDGIKTIGTNSSTKPQFCQNATSLKCFCLPKSMTYMNGTYMCNGAYQIDSVVFPDNMSFGGTSSYVFNGSVAKRLCLPKNLNTISSTYMFNGTNVIEANLPEGIPLIQANSCNWVSIPKIIVPSSVNNIGNNAFSCWACRTFICRAQTPPTLDTQLFAQNITALTNEGMTIYVPWSSDHSILNSYKTASIWSTYASLMQEMDIINDNYIKINTVPKQGTVDDKWYLIKEIGDGWWVEDLVNYPPKLYVNGELVVPDSITLRTNNIIFAVDDSVYNIVIKNGYPQSVSDVSVTFYDYLKGDGTAYIWIDLFRDPEPPANNRILTIEASPESLNGYPVGNLVKSGSTVWGSYGHGIYRQSTGSDVKYYAYNNYHDFTSYTAGSKYKLIYNGGQPGSVVGYKDDVQIINDSMTKILIPCVFSIFNFSTYQINNRSYTDGSGTTDSGKVYSVKVEDAVTGETLVNLRPCINVLTEEAGMFDEVSKQFFGNSNSSGTLTVGNDNN